jgi:predicted unusual protein kinase regulating ubiquinone biosynthesis (AarF/ABC1/UbiB family)
MRGAAMKAGQVLSTIEFPGLDADQAAYLQQRLASLRDNVPAVDWTQMRAVLADEWGEEPERVLAEIDPAPAAAASIGQVHRGRSLDGTEVAVKVQYPGIAEAIHADMQNLGLGLKLLSAIAPGIDTGAIAEEIRERIGEELDYELEAANHREMARAYKGHPFIVVPDVVTELSRERVLVSEYVEGRRFGEILGEPAEVRDRLGEVLLRFYLNGPLRHRLLNGDPHPGNSLFLDDGRVAFIDFGFFKHLSDTDVSQLVRSTRATYERDPQGLIEVIFELGALPPDPELAEPFFQQYDAIFGWAMSEEPLTVDTANTADMMRRYTEMRKADGFDSLTLPAEHFVLMRAVFLLLGLLGQLRATGTWIDVAGEWLLGSEPRTELGRQEADYFGKRFTYTTEVVA